LTVFLRAFVRGLSRVHGEIRRLTEADLKTWKAQIDRVVKVGKDEIHCGLGLAVVARDEHGNHPEIIEVFEDCVQRLDALRNRYLNLGCLAEWFVSGEAI
jgi:hypothetical protein